MSAGDGWVKYKHVGRVHGNDLMSLFYFRSAAKIPFLFESAVPFSSTVLTPGETFFYRK